MVASVGIPWSPAHDGRSAARCAPENRGQHLPGEGPRDNARPHPAPEDGEAAPRHPLGDNDNTRELKTP